MKVLVLLLLSGIALVAFTGCESEEDKNLYTAQQCINNANQNTVAACSSFLSGNESEDAYTLRCSIAFISEGIDESTIVRALEDIDQQGGSSDPTVTAISALAMSDTNTSAAALTTCTRSGSESLVALANFANLATATGSIAGILNITDPDAQQTALEGFISGYTNGDNDATDLGAAVVASQSSLCDAENGLMKGTEACDNINTAIANGGGTSDGVGQQLLLLLNSAND